MKCLHSELSVNINVTALNAAIFTSIEPAASQTVYVVLSEMRQYLKGVDCSSNELPDRHSINIHLIAIYQNVVEKMVPGEPFLGNAGTCLPFKNFGALFKSINYIQCTRTEPPRY